MRKGRPIVFLSDYGLEDEFVGICHAVIARISPASPVLGKSIRYLPIDAVILAVVDPGVGTPRRPVAVETSQGGQLLVGPDNGLLSLTWAERGGVARAVEITEPKVMLEPVSATFHGRDILPPPSAPRPPRVPLPRFGR